MTFRTQSYYLKKICLLTILVFIGTACIRKSRPKDILSHDQMVKALVEVYATEQKVNNLILDTDSAQSVFEKMKGKTFEHLGIPDSVFKKSYNYYVDRPQELELIYTALVDTLNLYEQRQNVTRSTRENPK